MMSGQRFSRAAMYVGSILLISLTAACGSGGGKDAILGMDTGAAAPIVPIVPVNQPTPDTTRPTVTQTVPTDGAQNAATNTRISATFSEDMDPASINGTTFQI